jgi:hypothetical protein
MKFLKNIWKEIKKQLTNTPSFLQTTSGRWVADSSKANDVVTQIEKALESNSTRLIFLIGPFGSGKTTHIQHFMRKHPHYQYFSKSFVKVNSIDFAFLHLTHYITRLIFMLICSGFAGFIIWNVPQIGALPLLLFVTYLFVKNAGNLIYNLHETLDNLLTRRDKIVIIEDLERSSLNSPDQWALLANLWQNKRHYLIALGYSPDEKAAKLKIVEYAMKLEGKIIETPPCKSINYKIIKHLDPDFPFEFNFEKDPEMEGWLSLFTPRETIMLYDQVVLRNRSREPLTLKEKQMSYVAIALEFLFEKTGLTKKELIFDEKTREIRGFVRGHFSPEQIFYIESFTNSLAPSVPIKLIEK